VEGSNPGPPEALVAPCEAADAAAAAALAYGHCAWVTLAANARPVNRISFFIDSRFSPEILQSATANN
jgi:hypothetical protein